MALTKGTLVAEVLKRQARFRRVRVAGAPDEGVGEFFLLIRLSAKEADIYVPLSAASGKKPAGFVYEIEGTAAGAIGTTEVSAKGAGVTQVVSGTLTYCRVPAGKSAEFRLLISMRGKAGKEYRIVIRRVQYKNDPGDARYQKLETPLESERLKFIS